MSGIFSKKSSSRDTGFTPRSSRSRETNFPTRDDEFTPNYEILCIFQKCNKIAAASFNIHSFAVKVLESCDNYRPDHVILNNLLSHLTPRLVLYNKNAPYEIIERISRTLFNENCKVQGLSSSLFTYANCKEILFTTQVLYSLDNGNYINSVINSADERLVCVLGALLNYLKENLASLTSNNIHELKIKSISSITFEKVVSIDNETYKSLNVYGTLQHPSGFKWHNQSYMDTSEGLSIYSIIEKNCCLLGSSKLRNFLFSPTNDFNELKKRHDVIKFCNEPSNHKSLQAMKTQISHLSPIEVLIGNVECANVRGKHWKCIYQNIYYSVLFAETCKENMNGVQLFHEVAMSITDEMYAMAYHMDRIIDFQSMEGNEIFVVKPGVSESLEKAKKKFSKLTSVINKVVPYEFDTVPKYINKIHILYIPEMKFLLSIPYWKKGLKKEELELPGLEYKFTTNKTAYYKTKRCYELDDLLGDPQIEIMMEEANIIRSLGKYLRQNIENTYSLIEKIASLDCIFALAVLAKEHDYVEPALNNEKKISIINGVHPLLKMFTNEFIPNSIASSPEESLVKIVYGPNSSGKTVYLKQVALLVYLAHIGSFIPAKEANVGMCCQIHTCLSSSESIISESSSFLNDLRKLISLINSSQPTSLLVLDEIGKGTTELNGVAVLASCLNYFLSLGGRSPHVLVSTHLTDVSDYLQSSGSSFSVQVMNYTIEDGKFVFLYSLKGQNDIQNIDSASSPIPEAPELINVSAKKVLSALRSGENVTPYTTLRIQKCQRYYTFLQRFSTIDAKKEGIIRKLRRKVKSLMS